MRHRGELVTRAITVDIEDCDRDAQVALELLLGSEGDRPHPRVQSIRSDDKVEVPRSTAGELDAHPISVIVERLDGVVEDRLHLTAECVVDDSCQVRARDADIAASGSVERGARIEVRDPPPVAGYFAEFADPVSLVHQLRDDAHAVRDIEARTPEVHNVAAFPEVGGALHENRLMPRPAQPVRQRRPSDSRSYDQHPHPDHLLDHRFDRWSKCDTSSSANARPEARCRGIRSLDLESRGNRSQAPVARVERRHSAQGGASRPEILTG